jgi:regulator of protease activity HflC (stomatin/prohibitin superfamily)
MISHRYQRKSLIQMKGIMNAESSVSNRERVTSALNGWGMLLLNFGWLLGSVALLIYSGKGMDETHGQSYTMLFVASWVLVALGILMLFGFFALRPNEARVLILFGAYKGTVRNSGFHWVNPFYSRGCRMSLRAYNFNSDKIKVNDKRGNPIEIAAVVVWRVTDTAQAMFDVEDYKSYLKVQSESAIRHLASSYAYDDGEDNEVTLRSGAEDVANALKTQLLERLEKAGVVVDEARITHLAYAPEIAQAMLRRQQAEAVIAARQKIVHGAVSMVDMALRELSEKSVVKLDEERKAAMVSNLLVVLCAEAEVSPVINTGTLYS